jgi:hypothetical protein
MIAVYQPLEGRNRSCGLSALGHNITPVARHLRFPHLTHVAADFAITVTHFNRIGTAKAVSILVRISEKSAVELTHVGLQLF